MLCRKSLIVSFRDTYETYEYFVGIMYDFFNAKTSGTYTKR